MRRLLLAPIVVAPIAAAAVWREFGYLSWPIATTAWSLIAPRREGPNDEADVWG